MTKDKPKMSLHFGALVEGIDVQLERQGYNVNKKDCERYQKIADAIVMLHLNDIIPDSVVYNAHQKLMKKISVSVHQGVSSR
jgi:hypothetical protein